MIEDEEQVEPWPPLDYASDEVFARERKARRAARKPPRPVRQRRDSSPNDFVFDRRKRLRPQDPAGALFCAACGQLAPDEIPFLSCEGGDYKELTCPRYGCEGVVRHQQLVSEAEELPRARPGFTPIETGRARDWGGRQWGWVVGDKRRGRGGGTPRTRPSRPDGDLPDELLPQRVDPGIAPRPLSDLEPPRPEVKCAGCWSLVPDTKAKSRWIRVRSGGIDLGSCRVNTCQACWGWLPAQAALQDLEARPLFDTPAFSKQRTAAAAVRKESEARAERARAEALAQAEARADAARAQSVRAQARRDELNRMTPGERARHAAEAREASASKARERAARAAARREEKERLARERAVRREVRRKERLARKEAARKEAARKEAARAARREEEKLVRASQMVNCSSVGCLGGFPNGSREEHRCPRCLKCFCIWCRRDNEEFHCGHCVE